MAVKCKAQSSQHGRQCKAWAVTGAAVSVAHGGATSQVKPAAQRRREAAAVEADAQALLAHDGVQAVEDPLEALAHLTGEALKVKEALAARVNALNNLSYTADGAGTEQLRAEWFG